MKFPEFSEFTFGYALTDNLINRVLSGVRGVPLFPSLKEEGKSGVGYDIKIPRYSRPLFLQFKLPQVIRRHRKKWDHNLKPLYYRIHLMRRSDSSQHSSLLRLARRGRDVYYAGPEFHTRRDLNLHYSQGNVPLRSAFFQPQDIGRLSDESHHIAYKSGINTAWVCSRPRQLQHSCSGETFLGWLAKAAQSAPRVESPKIFFDQLTDEIIQAAVVQDEESDNDDIRREKQQMILPEDVWHQPQIADLRREIARHRDRLGDRRVVGYAARLLLDCEIVIAGHGEDI